MKQAKEIEVVTLMIKLYCKKNHKMQREEGKELCPECEELLDYVKFRRSKCPFGDNKPFCANCRIHCYKPSMREKIRKVMRFSGPRMIFSHPIIAMNHLIETKKQKKLMAKEDAMKKEQEAKKVENKVEPSNADSKIENSGENK